MYPLVRAVAPCTLVALAGSPAVAGGVFIGGNVFINGHRVQPGYYAGGHRRTAPFPATRTAPAAARTVRTPRPPTTIVQAPPRHERAAPIRAMPEIIDIS